MSQLSIAQVPSFYSTLAWYHCVNRMGTTSPTNPASKQKEEDYAIFII